MIAEGAPKSFMRLRRRSPSKEPEQAGKSPATTQQPQPCRGGSKAQMPGSVYSDGRPRGVERQLDHRPRSCTISFYLWQLTRNPELFLLESGVLWARIAESIVTELAPVVRPALARPLSQSTWHRSCRTVRLYTKMCVVVCCLLYELNAVAQDFAPVRPPGAAEISAFAAHRPMFLAAGVSPCPSYIQSSRLGRSTRCHRVVSLGRVPRAYEGDGRRLPSGPPQS
jgi:hypothetical protein